jgi:hypothetical protein
VNALAPSQGEVPKQRREMLGLFKELREHWPTLRAARWAIWIALVVGAISGYAVGSFWSSGTVSILRERVAQLQESRSPSQLRIKEITTGSSYRVQATDDVVQVNNAEDIVTTILLPSGFSKGKLVTIKDKKGNANAFHIIIVSEAGKIDGLSRLELVVDKGSYALIWDGDAWSMN